MGWFKRSQKPVANPAPIQEPQQIEMYTLPSQQTVKEFGKINIYPGDGVNTVEVTMAMEPQGRMAEGWQTGVALDASASMKDWFGRMLIGTVPPKIAESYKKKGWVTEQKEDGREVLSFMKEAYEDAIHCGYLRLTDNIVQPLARQFIGYLADSLDADGGTTVIYWACGQGDSVEEVGDFTAAEIQTMDIIGPTKTSFGQKTVLTPAVDYFVTRFQDAKRGMFVFITDGKIDDLEEVIRYTKRLAQQIEAGQRNFVKLVLIGVGDRIDKDQFLALDNLDTGTSVDVWDSKIADEMRSLIEIFAEVVDANLIVAPVASIYDEQGSLIKRYSDGLPAKISFELEPSIHAFELEVAGRRIRQDITH